MVTDLFGTLLEELGKSLDVPNLHPDINNSCLIKMKNGQTLQLEIDPHHQFLVIGADLGIVPPGKYRENLFKEALKANDMPHPLDGILAYSKKTDSLILFKKIYLTNLNGETIAVSIIPFLEKADLWSTALSRGEIPSIGTVNNNKSSSGMFGLR